MTQTNSPDPWPPREDVSGTVAVYGADALLMLRQDENGYDHTLGYGTTRRIPDNSIDAIITDPPYGLTGLTQKKVTDALTRWISGDTSYVPAGGGFMGQAWDRFVPPPALWAEILRVLKPGGYIAAFAGSRTEDLMSISMRLAGVSIIGQIPWLRSDVFPKTKYALKSGYEPVILGQKPLDGTIEQNHTRWGTGALNIDACRVPFASAADEAESKGKNQHAKYGTLHGGNSVYGDFSSGGVRDNYDAPGRWPTNILLSREVADELDSRYPTSKSRKGKPRAAASPGSGWGMTATGTEYDDEGGPSRFFPVFEEDPAGFHYAGRAPAKERPVAADGTKHTTVKPLSVIRWLLRLLTPPGGHVLDPFLGSGTTAEAAISEGFTVTGFESHRPYLPLIAQRVERISQASS